MNFLRSNSNLNWQTERAKILHRACLRIEHISQAGESLSDVIHGVAVRIRGRRFVSQPDRRLDLSDATLKRHYLKWLRQGKLSDAFKLNFKPRLPDHVKKSNAQPEYQI